MWGTFQTAKLSDILLLSVWCEISTEINNSVEGGECSSVYYALYLDI